ILHFVHSAFALLTPFRMTCRSLGTIAILAMTCLIPSLPTNLFAQIPGEQEYTILGITVEGNQSGTAETIIAQSTLRKGDKTKLPNDENIRRATNRLWQQNIYSDVNIEVSKILPQE